MALRRVKPGVAHLVTPFLVQHPDLLQWMPNETPAARIWVLSVDLRTGMATRTLDVGLLAMCRRYRGGFSRSSHTISDLLDWVHANTRGRATVRHAPFHPVDGAQDGNPGKP